MPPEFIIRRLPDGLRPGRVKGWKNPEIESERNRPDSPSLPNLKDIMASQPLYGPHNPHPLSQMRTELVWEGKYDEYGNRREVDVAGLAMPLQKIETIDQPRAEADEAG